MSPGERVGGSDQNGDQHRSARQRQTDAQPVLGTRLAARQARWPPRRLNSLAPRVESGIASIPGPLDGVHPTRTTSSSS